MTALPTTGCTSDMLEQVRRQGFRRTAVLTAATVGTIAGATTVLADSSEAPTAPASESRAPEERASGVVFGFDGERVASVSQEQAASFAVLREPQRTDDRRGDATGMYGANFSLARTIRTEVGPVAVVPADGFICLYVPDGGSCVPNDVAEAGKLVLTIEDGGKVARGFALVPDAVTDVRLVSETGSMDAAPVRNIVSIDDPNAEAVILEYADGSTVRRGF